MPEPDVTQPSPPPLHERVPKSFEKGVRHLYQKEYEKAEAAFQEVVSQESLPRLIVQRAENYLSVIRQNRKPAQETSEDPDDMILRAVFEGNRGNTSVAKEMLFKVREVAPNNDKVHYLLASTAALEGDAAGAVEHLQQAISLDERNRINAKFDADFEELREDPAFAQLVGIEVGAPLTPKPVTQKPRTVLEGLMGQEAEGPERAESETSEETPEADLPSDQQPEQEASSSQTSETDDPDEERPDPPAH